MIKTSVEDFTLRFAGEEDIPVILSFIKELAAYEEMLDQVVATEEILKQTLFEQKKAEVLIGEYKGEAVSFALFFHNFSTFLGRPGLYLEDVYVKPNMRKKGIGKAILSTLAQIALERNCGRFEWSCLDWNEPSINFYKNMGAAPMDQWTVYRVSGESLEKLAYKDK